MTRWSAADSRRRVGPVRPRRPGHPRMRRVLLGVGALALVAGLAPAAIAVTDQAPRAPEARAVTALPAATLPPADPTPPSVTAVPLTRQARSGGSQVARSATPLQLVAVTWTGADPQKVELRSTDASGRWGAWLPLDANSPSERDDAPARAVAGGGTDPVWVGDRTAVEVRATRGGAPVTEGLAVQRIDPGHLGQRRRDRRPGP